MKGTYIFLAEGYEPLEALAPMDVLRRAKIDVSFVNTGASRPGLFSKSAGEVPSTQGYGLPAQLSWDEFLKAENGADDYSGCMIFPGGLPGAETLGQNAQLMSILEDHYAHGGLVAAICAAPAKVIARNIDVKGKKMTVYEGFEKDLTDAGATATGEGVTVDGKLITAKGPGLAIDFGLAILYKLADRRIADVVKKAMML